MAFTEPAKPDTAGPVSAAPGASGTGCSEAGSTGSVLAGADVAGSGGVSSGISADTLAGLGAVSADGGLGLVGADDAIVVFESVAAVELVCDRVSEAEEHADSASAAAASRVVHHPTA